MHFQAGSALSFPGSFKIFFQKILDKGINLWYDENNKGVVNTPCSEVNTMDLIPGFI